LRGRLVEKDQADFEQLRTDAIWNGRRPGAPSRRKMTWTNDAGAPVGWLWCAASRAARSLRCPDISAPGPGVA